MDNKMGLNFEFLTATLSCIGDGIIAVGMESNILYMNTAASQITGWTVEEALGKGFDEVFPLVHADTGEPLQGPAKRALETQGRVGLKNRSMLLSKEGGRKYVSATCSPIMDSNGVMEGIVVVFRDISLVKQMEEDLRTERNNLKESVVSLETLRSFFMRLFEGFPAIVWKTDIEGKTIYINKAWTEFTGKAASTSLGYDWIDELHPDDRKGIFKIHSEAFEAKLPYVMEYRLLTSSGEYRWMRSVNRPVYDADGKFEGFMGMALDISETKKANEALERYMLFFERARDIILFIDMDGNILDANKSAIQEYGYQREELLTKNIGDLRAKGEKTKAFLENIYKEGTVFENEHRRKDGSSFPVEVNAQGTEIGGKRFIASIIRNVSERKDSERALRESEEKFRQIFHNSSETILVQEIQEDGLPGHVIEVNDTACREWGYTREEFLFMNPAAIDNYQKVDNVEHLIKAFNENGHLVFETTTSTKDGQRREIEISAHKMMLNGRMVLLSFIRDITDSRLATAEMKRARDQAESANRAKSDFLANMSHEIRTPLNGIVGMIDLTMLTELNKDQEENLTIAKTCVNSLMKIINDILDFSKMEAGKLILDNIDFNIKKLVDETIKAHSVQANEKGLELTYSFSSNIPQYIAGDPNRLCQVLNNLMSNAIKFTGHGEIVLGVKKVEASDENIDLLFFISDTGIGIPKEDIDKLFVSFSQIDGSITRKFGGTGLGLAISRQLVGMMGGDIWVKSEEGKGSIFYFTIRCKKGSKPAEHPAENNIVRKKEKSREILLVEDDIVNQTVVSHMLKKRGNSVDIANNGLEALTSSKNKLYDVILMDIQLPEMDGIEATRHIREREGKDRHTPIIALTAFALQGDREKFLGLGMDEYVPKPVKMEDLFLAIDKVCEYSDGEPVFNERPRLGKDGELIFERETHSKSSEDLQPIINEITNNIKKLSEVIAGGDMTVIEAAAHRIKELFSEVDAEEMKGMAFRIELAARRGNLKGVIEGTIRINHEFETYKTSLNCEGGLIC